MKFVPAISAIIINSLLVIIGLAIIAYFGIWSKSVFAGFIGVMFLGFGVVIFIRGMVSVNFDKAQNLVSKGSKNVEINMIHAIQIIKKRVNNRKSHYYCYELNLVLKDGERFNVVDHAKIDKIKQQSLVLSNFLGVVIWDISAI